MITNDKKYLPKFEIFLKNSLSKFSFDKLYSNPLIPHLILALNVIDVKKQMVLI